MSSTGTSGDGQNIRKMQSANHLLESIFPVDVCKRSSGRIECDNYIHITRPEVKNYT